MNMRSCRAKSARDIRRNFGIEDPSSDKIMYYKYVQLDKIVHDSTCKMRGTNNGILTNLRVLNRRSPAHHHIVLDLLIIAVLSIHCKSGRRNTVWCKEMAQQLDGQ